MAKQKRRLRPWVLPAALFLIGVLMAGLVAVGIWAVSQADLSGGKNLELKTYSNFYSNAAGDPLYTVCIDAGHGGKDSGATCFETQRVEKDDNLTFALLLRRELRQIGIGVVMTRTDDTTLSLEERVAIAESTNCDLYICVHRNSGNGVTGGVEIWIDDDMNTWEMYLGQQYYDPSGTGGDSGKPGSKGRQCRGRSECGLLRQLPYFHAQLSAGIRVHRQCGGQLLVHPASGAVCSSHRARHCYHLGSDDPKRRTGRPAGNHRIK